MTTYDVNVWDWIGHETEYAFEGWRIDLWECDDEYNRQGDLPFKIIYLNNSQAKMLTLGVDEKDGGDYCGDSDFWIDPDCFLETYKNIPRKVRRQLSEYVIKKEECNA
jgi:hypothetical protein